MCIEEHSTHLTIKYEVCVWPKHCKRVDKKDTGPLEPFIKHHDNNNSLASNHYEKHYFIKANVFKEIYAF